MSFHCQSLESSTEIIDAFFPMNNACSTNCSGHQINYKISLLSHHFRFGLDQPRRVRGRETAPLAGSPPGVAGTHAGGITNVLGLPQLAARDTNGKGDSEYKGFRRSAGL